MSNYPLQMAIQIVLKSKLLNLDPKWLYSQMAHETNGFKSELCHVYNNYAGVTQASPNHLLQPDGTCYYMSFNSPSEFISYFSSYLNYYRPEGIHHVYSLSDYVNCLKLGGYFGDSVENYFNGCVLWHATLR